MNCTWMKLTKFHLILFTFVQINLLLNTNSYTNQIIKSITNWKTIRKWTRYMSFSGNIKEKSQYFCWLFLFSSRHQNFIFGVILFSLLQISIRKLFTFREVLKIQLFTQRNLQTISNWDRKWYNLVTNIVAICDKK